MWERSSPTTLVGDAHRPVSKRVREGLEVDGRLNLCHTESTSVCCGSWRVSEARNPRVGTEQANECLRAHVDASCCTISLVPPYFPNFSTFPSGNKL